MREVIKCLSLVSLVGLVLAVYPGATRAFGNPFTELSSNAPSYLEGEVATFTLVLTLPPFLEHQILPVFVKWLLPSRHAFLQTQQA